MPGAAGAARQIFAERAGSPEPAPDDDVEVADQSAAVERIQAVKQRIDAARIQLDHAEVEVIGPDAGSVDERLATVRALLRDGDRLLQDAGREAGEDEDLNLVSESAVESEAEDSRERTVRR